MGCKRFFHPHYLIYLFTFPISLIRKLCKLYLVKRKHLGEVARENFMKTFLFFPVKKKSLEKVCVDKLGRQSALNSNLRKILFRKWEIYSWKCKFSFH